MTLIRHTRVLDTETLLMALLPALGPRAALGPLRAQLKWAGAQPLLIARSVLEFVDAEGRILGRHDEAFGLTPGAQLHPAYSQRLADERQLPRGAVLHRWRLNDWMIAAPVAEPESVWPSLAVTYLPLQLPLDHDDHFVVGLVNIGEQPLDIARGVQEAVCWVDGDAWSSVAGRIWNGPYLVRPGHATMQRFRLTDFPGVPTYGAHEVALELLGRRSAPQRVQWHGTPWLPPATPETPEGR